MADAEPPPLHHQPKPAQVIENQLELALAHGFALPDGVTKEEFLAVLLDPARAQEFTHEHPEVRDRYVAVLREITRVRHSFGALLGEAAADPRSFGVDIAWRQSQRCALECFAW